MYFPFFMLHDWGKRSTEACSSHYAVLPKHSRGFSSGSAFLLTMDSFVL